MIDYSAMSDYDINLLVNRALGLKHYPNEEKKVIEVFGEIVIFDPCNNPADAWPIIIKNGISVQPTYLNDEWIAVKFKPTRDNSKPHEIDTYSSGRPLRAAMIVYLQMMEHKS